MRIRFLGIIAILVALAGCASQAPAPVSLVSLPSPTATDFNIVSGSENKDLEPLVQEFASKSNVTVKFSYEGSVTMMHHLQAGFEGDAVWPASSIWLDMGDRGHQVRYRECVYRSPVVFAVKKSVAARLGWVGKSVSVDQILGAAQSGNLSFMMTSASQSNSGASAYLGYLNAFAGKPGVLETANLRDAKVRQKVRALLGLVNRSAGSSGWLKELFLKQYDSYDAMVNYEVLAIEANQELVKAGKEPLYLVYPRDGLAIADSTLGFVSHGNSGKEAFFKGLQGYLLAPATQQRIMNTGRRTGPLGLGLAGADPRVFNPAWGVQVQQTLVPIRMPRPEVVTEALNLYQELFRKPSLTVFCLDFSGSMEGEGSQGLKAAMRQLLLPSESKKFLLQPTARDLTYVVPFNDHILAQWKLAGNSPAQCQKLAAQISAQAVGGGTDIYSPVVLAQKLIGTTTGVEGYSPSIILMTDGRSSGGQATIDTVRSGMGGLRPVPVYSILFGDADPSQLDQLAALTSAKVVDGRQDLSVAFREVRSNN